jgi:predicted MFS family arabinose efflux permease
MSLIRLLNLHRWREFSPNARLFLFGKFIMAFGGSGFFVLMNLYIKALGYGESVIGQVNSMSATAAALFSLPAALLASRMAIKSLLITAAVLVALGDLTVVLSSSVPLLTAGGFIAGTGGALFFVSLAPFVMRNSSPSERTALFSMSYGLDIIAGAAGSALFGWLSSHLITITGSDILAFRYVLVSCCMIVVASTLIFSRIVPQRPAADERLSLKSMLAGNDWKLLSKVLFPNFVIGFGAGMTIPFLNVYFQKRFSATPAEIGVFFSVCQVFMTLGVFCGPALAGRFGLIMAIVLTQMTSIPFMLILAFTGRLEWALLAYFIRAALMNMGGPLISQFSMELVDRSRHATTNGLKAIAWNGAWMISTWVGGLVIERHGFTFAIVGTAVLYGCGTMLYFQFFRTGQYVAIGKKEPSLAA